MKHKFKILTGLAVLSFGCAFLFQLHRAFTDPELALGTRCKIMWHDAGYRVPFRRTEERHISHEGFLISIGLQDPSGTELDPGFCAYDPFSDTPKLVEMRNG
ncbi:hypothetical protein [Ruegeria sp. HKCCA5426]|uniref:hypothetical protein n=1 Tax=Ruegeria sp. HKCCA5426 TaxID=2682985 RepID=UPI0014888B1D|nr:hypothetical protein [Ruegeria sp. HKCCA5426]